MYRKIVPAIVRHRTSSDSQNMAYAEQEMDELLNMLRETENLDEQGDILQYLVDAHGLDFHTGKRPIVSRGTIITVLYR